jgi:hypothetical protein
VRDEFLHGRSERIEVPRRDSDLVTLETTLEVMAVLDEIRAQSGVAHAKKDV